MSFHEIFNASGPCAAKETSQFQRLPREVRHVVEFFLDGLPMDQPVHVEAQGHIQLRLVVETIWLADKPSTS